jgi:hypothetical protein
MFLGGSDACVWSCARWNAAYFVCVCIALLNSFVRCARLQLAVAVGRQKCVGLIRTELGSSEDP